MKKPRAPTVRDVRDAEVFISARHFIRPWPGYWQTAVDDLSKLIASAKAEAREGPRKMQRSADRNAQRWLDEWGKAFDNLKRARDAASSANTRARRWKALAKWLWQGRFDGYRGRLRSSMRSHGYTCAYCFERHVEWGEPSKCRGCRAEHDLGADHLATVIALATWWSGVAKRVSYRIAFGSANTAAYGWASTLDDARAQAGTTRSRVLWDAIERRNWWLDDE